MRNRITIHSMCRACLKINKKFVYAIFWLYNQKKRCNDKVFYFKKRMKRTLEEQRLEFCNQKFLATPLAGIIVWTIIGFVGIYFSHFVSVWTIFIGTGSIVYLGLFLSKFTGENFLDKNKPKNEFDTLFLFTAGQAILVYSIAIPFFLADYTSLPMTVGILTGLMWLPFSWIINHWVGIFHTLTRTISVVALWYLLPEDRFIAIPFTIVLIYLFTLLILKNRKKSITTAP